MAPATTPRRSTRASPVARSREPTPVEAASTANKRKVTAKGTNAYGGAGRADAPNDTNVGDSSFSSGFDAARENAQATATTLPSVQEEPEDEAGANTTSRLDDVPPQPEPHVNGPVAGPDIHPAAPLDISYLKIFGLMILAVLLTTAIILGATQQDAQQLVTAILERSPVPTTCAVSNSGPSTFERTMVENQMAAWKRVSWFDPITRALVDPYLSSPSLYHWIDPNYPGIQFPWTGEEALHNGPNVALRTSRELTDCWCTAVFHREQPADHTLRSNPFYQFKAQLAIDMGYWVHPQQLIIEYAPPTALPDIGAAPVYVELWAHIEQAEVRDRAWALALGCKVDEIASKKPALDAPPPPLTQIEKRAGQLKHLLGIRKAPPDPASMALSEEFVRIKTMTFEVKNEQWVQAVDIDVFDELGGPGATGKIVLRVTGNKGREYTCFYRVRLEGRWSGLRNAKGGPVGQYEIPQPRVGGPVGQWDMLQPRVAESDGQWDAPQPRILES